MGFLKRKKLREEKVELVNRGQDRSDALSLSTLESGQQGTRTASSSYRGGVGAAPFASVGGGVVVGGPSDTASEYSAGPEKWRRVRRGAHLSYVPFDVEDYEDLEAIEERMRDMTFPPPSELADDSKNWPGPCPFLHLKFTDFAIIDKQRFIKTAYYFWYFLVMTFLWNTMASVVAVLMSPSPNPTQVYISFTIAFVGFWWFFFAHFRLLYFAMRRRKAFLFVLYQLETVIIFFLGTFVIFSLLGNMTQLLAPLAPGSPVPVKQQPLIPTILQSIGIALWLIVMIFCFYFIRRAHYFKNLPLAVEREMWIKEQQPGYAALQRKKFSEWLVDLFREKPDAAVPPVRCGMLQGRDLWLQGQLTLDTVFFEFKADVTVFDHLVWERIHYQEVLEIRKYSETGILFRVVNPSRKETEDLEMIFDYNDRQIRADQYKAVRKLWRRVGRNMDLVTKLRLEKMRKMRRPQDLAEADQVEAFTRARRKETRERIAAHQVTYRDWQKLLGGVKIHILNAGEALLHAGDDFNKLYHVAQGRIEVSEIVDGAYSVGDDRSTVTGDEAASLYSHDMDEEEYKQQDPDQLEAKAWARYTESRQRRHGGSSGRGSDGSAGGAGGAAGDPELEYEDPRYDDIEAGYGGERGGAAHSSRRSDGGSDDEDVSEYTSASSETTASSMASSAYTSMHRAINAPESVLLGTLRKDDIFGVVPFLLSRGDQVPKSGLTFTARDPITVVFSIDAEFAKKEVLKPKKEVTAAFYKYLAVILGERTEAAEDAMFMRKVREKRLEEARAEEALLAQRRQAEEEAAFTATPVDADGDTAFTSAMQRAQAVRRLFNLSAAEDVLFETKGSYTFRDQTDPNRRIIKAPGTFYVTTHYFAFAGKKFIDANHMEINRPVKDVMRHDEVIAIRFEGKKGVLFTDIKLDRRMFEPKKAEEREDYYRQVMSKWRSENEVTSKEMRKLLRRKMTRLSLGYLNQAERLTQQSIEGLMADMSEREKKQLFAGSVPIGLNRNQVVIGEHNFNDNLFLLCTGIVRVQRVQEHTQNALDSGRAMDRVVFQEIHSGQIFGFDSFLTGAPAYSSVVVDSEKCVVRSCTKEQIMARLREDRRLAAKFYSVAAVSIASRLSELSPLDLFL